MASSPTDIKIITKDCQPFPLWPAKLARPAKLAQSLSNHKPNTFYRVSFLTAGKTLAREFFLAGATRPQPPAQGISSPVNPESPEVYIRLS